VTKGKSPNNSGKLEESIRKYSRSRRAIAFGFMWRLIGSHQMA